MRGLLISFEGPDNSSKSTQASLLEKLLTEIGYKVKVISFPNEETSIGDFIYSCLKNGIVKYINNKAFQYLYIADQMNLQDTINEYMKRGYIVILDRYDLSSIVYMLSTTALKHEKEILTSFEDKKEYLELASKVYSAQSFLQKPDLTFLFDIDDEVMISRNKLSDEHEKNIKLMKQVNSIYKIIDKVICDNRKYININANNPKMIILREIFNKLQINEFEEYIDREYLL